MLQIYYSSLITPHVTHSNGVFTVEQTPLGIDSYAETSYGSDALFLYTNP